MMKQIEGEDDIDNTEISPVSLLCQKIGASNMFRPKLNQLQGSIHLQPADLKQAPA